MKLSKYLIPFLIVAAFPIAVVNAQVVGQETVFDRTLNTRDDQPLREFVESKENIDVKEKASNLEISGDVRFEWRSIREKGYTFYVDREKIPTLKGNDLTKALKQAKNDSMYEFGPFKQYYRNLRGGDHVDAAGIPISTNDFDVEFNLKFKYNFKKAWCFAHVQFDNPAGVRGRNACYGRFPVFDKDGNVVIKEIKRDSKWAIKGSGEGMFITLKRAYIGYNIWADGKHRLDIEVGRRKLDDIFDSEIQFTSRFDGILLKYASSIEDFSDWYWDIGGFVIDERVNHFGWVTEIGLIDIMDSGFDLRYNYIDWSKWGRNRCFVFNPLGARFQNSEVTLTYTIHPKIFSKEMPVEFYGGFLVNHAAKKERFLNHKRKNLGWYAGVYIGNVNKEGDWSFDLEYIGVQAQAVSENDVGSIGRGNILDENLLDILNELKETLSSRYSWPTGSDIDYSTSYYYSDSYGPSFRPEFHKNQLLPLRGNTNFVGWRFEFLYAITDNLSIDMIYEFSDAEDQHIGGRHHYDDFELEAVYAF